MATATAIESSIEKPADVLSKLVYPVALLASLSIWLLALRAPLWLDETLAYWQVSGGFWKIWSRSALMPSSIGYLYTLWAAKSILGSQEIALKIPSTLAMLGAVYFLFLAARELFDTEIAFITCVFFSLEPNVVFAATDARPYAFALLATNLAIFALHPLDGSTPDASSDPVRRRGGGDSLLSLPLRRHPACVCDLLSGDARALDQALA